MKTKQVEGNLEDFAGLGEFDAIIKDVFDAPIILLSKRGHGKSSSLSTIIMKLKKKHPKTIIKVFDLSLFWFNKSPLKHRQRVTVEAIKRNGVANIGDCVYEVGSLSEEMRRRFVAWIINKDYRFRYNMGLKLGIESVRRLNRIIYIIEEANCVFGSFSLRKNDEFSAALKDFISVGRNYGLSAFMVCTAEVGELSPSLRRRSTRLIGRITSDSDLRALNRRAKNLGNIAIKIPKYHFVYHNGEISPIFRVRDEVETRPTDFITEKKKEYENIKPKKLTVNDKIALSFITGVGIAMSVMFIMGW